jgi:hypothetical protein
MRISYLHTTHFIASEEPWRLLLAAVDFRVNLVSASSQAH